MSLILKYSFYVVALFSIIFGEMMLTSSTLFWLWAVIDVGLLGLIMWWITVHRVSIGVCVYLATPVLLFVLSGIFFVLFIETILFRHILVIVSAMIAGLMVQNVFTFVREPHRYQPYALENISLYINLITLFLMLGGVYSLVLLLTLPIWPFVPVIMAICFVLALQTLWALKIPLSKSWQYGLALSIGTTEIFIAASFLPAPPLVLSTITFTVYYFFINIVRDYLAGKLERRMLQRYAIFSIIVLAVVAVTSPWK